MSSFRDSISLSSGSKTSRNFWVSVSAITRIKTKRAALEGLSAQGYDTEMAQSEIEWGKESGEVVENNVNCASRRQYARFCCVRGTQTGNSTRIPSSVSRSTVGGLNLQRR